MTDTVSKLKRSHIMAQVRSIDTKPEITMRRFLFSKGFRYRKNVKSLPGTPDIVLPKYKTAIFVHGCFWHGHKKCKAAKLPKSRIEYWLPKINKNKDRDKQRKKELENLGWNVLEVWECQIRSITEESSLKQELFLRDITSNL